MRRPATITLALLGAGAIGGAIFAWPSRQDECAAARARVDKFADDICSRAAASSSSSGSSSHWWRWGGSSSSHSSSSSSSSSRGGFGSFFSGGGG